MFVMPWISTSHSSLNRPSSLSTTYPPSPPLPLACSSQAMIPSELTVKQQVSAAMDALRAPLAMGADLDLAPGDQIRIYLHPTEALNNAPPDLSASLSVTATALSQMPSATPIGAYGDGCISFVSSSSLVCGFAQLSRDKIWPQLLLTPDLSFFPPNHPSHTRRSRGILGSCTSAAFAGEKEACRGMERARRAGQCEDHTIVLSGSGELPFRLSVSFGPNPLE